MSEDLPQSSLNNISGRRNCSPTFRRTFASFKYRNFRLWFSGQVVSLFGTWMQTTAQGFLIYELTHSPAFLGYVGFAAGVPSILFTMYGGVVADRLPRRKLLIITQSTMMCLALILALLSFQNIVQPWHIIVLAFGLGIANAFDSPARLAFVSELVEPEDITNAIALNTMMFNTASAIGPAVAGLTYSTFGPGWCFLINALSFIAVISALFLMKIKSQKQTTQKTSTASALLEGLHYIYKHRVIRTLIILVASVSLFGMSLGTLLPAWSVKILNGNAVTNGLLFSARGVGSIISALSIASLAIGARRGRLVSIGSFLFGIFIALFAFSSWLWLSILLIALVGVSTVLVANLSNSTIQSLTPLNLRGRVMGVYSTVFMGSMPIGALILGTIAEYAGEITAALTCSIFAILVAGFVRFYIPEIREIE